MQLSSIEGILAMPKSAYPIACSVCTTDGGFEAIFDGPEGPRILQAELRSRQRSVISITATRWDDAFHRPIH